MSVSAEYRNALEAGTTLNEYRLESVLGAGGFGITYLARDVFLDKSVAVKEYLPRDLALRALDGSVAPVSTGHRFDYQWGLDRFIQEASALARVSHPHIVRVHRHFELNGTGYMVMDFEQGESLTQFVERAPLPPEDEIRRLLMPLLDGLAAIHAENILHRDIKPASIFIRSDGQPVLLDFGAARAVGSATRSLNAVLTKGYTPLEQYSPDGNPGPWSDLYALAGVLFRMVTGRNPPDAVTRLQLDTVPAALHAARGRYSAVMLQTISRGLSVNAGSRPRSVAGWRALLESAAVHGQAGTAPTTAVIGAALKTVVKSPAAGAQATVRTAVSAPDHSEAWKRLTLAVFWLVVISIGISWYLKREIEPAPAPAIAAPSAKRAPVQVEVVQAPPLAELPVSPAISAPPADVVLVKPVELSQGRVPERMASEFRGADRDGDGYLAPAEVEERFPLIAKELAIVDRDGDGLISIEEFAEWRLQPVERRPLRK